MRGLTIGVGNYRDMAERAAESVALYAGIAVDVITECPQGIHPSAYRLWLIDDYSEPVFWFDADTLMIAEWDLSAVAGPFSAMLDRPGYGQDAECHRWGVDARRYFNAGVMVIHPEAFPAMRLARNIVKAPAYQSAFIEQTAINVAIQWLGIEVNYLEKRFNHFASDPLPPDTVLIHGAGGNRKAFDSLAKQLWSEKPCSDSP